ncbi:MAG: hypothetical protein ABJ047_13415 [Parasphingorhabdus sp.]
MTSSTTTHGETKFAGHQQFINMGAGQRFWEIARNHLGLRHA